MRRRMGQITFFDQTSRNMRSAILSAQRSELRMIRARQIMQTKNLTTGIGRDVDRMTVEMETEETGKLRRMGSVNGSNRIM